ncbi:MAG: TVP38/TMEM64 family protein [Vicinamibacterales bacterium]
MHWRGALVILVAAAGIAVALTLPVQDWLLAVITLARGSGAVGVAVYVIAYVAAAILMLPGSLLTLGAGFAWGPSWGLLIASPASVLAATVAFLLGRTVLRRRVSRWLHGRPGVRGLDAAIHREGFRIVLLLRLSPLVPFDVLNYALSASSVRLRDYVLASIAGMLPWTAVYVYLGSLAPVATELASGQGVLGTSDTALLFAGGLVTLGVAVYLGRRGRAMLERQGFDRADAVAE